MHRRVIVLVALLAACDNGPVGTVELPLEGALKCDQKSGLNSYTRPIMLELRDGQDFHQEVISGNFEPYGANVTVTDKARTWTVRFGECSRTYDGKPPPGKTAIEYECGEPTWYSETKLTVDPRSPPKIQFVAPPTTLACWRGDKPN